MISDSARFDCRQSNLYRGFRPIAILLKLLGFFPVTGVFRERVAFRFRWLSLTTLHFLVVALAFYGGLATIIYLSSDDFWDFSITFFSNSFTAKTHVICAILWILYFSLIFLQGFKMASGYPRYFDKWQTMELNLIKNHNVGIQPNTIITSSIPEIVVSLGLQGVITCVGLANTSMLEKKMLSARFFSQWMIITVVMTFLESMLHASFCYFNRYVIRNLREIARDLRGFSLQLAQLQYIKKKYLLLVEIIRDTKRQFSIYLCLMFAFNGAIACLSSYYLIVVLITEQNVTECVIHSATVVAYNSLKISSACFYGSQIRNEVENILVIILNISSSESAIQSHSKDLLSTVWKSLPSINFVACGLFDVNLKTLMALVGIIATYLLVLVQFEMNTNSV